MDYRFREPVRGDYVNGKFVISAEVSGTWTSRSPAERTDEIGTFSYSYGSINAAVSAARDAFRIWRKRPVEERASILKKYQEAIRAREGALVEVIAREAGKPSWDAQREVSQLHGLFDATFAAGLRQVSDVELPQLSKTNAGMRAFSRHQPLGVMAVVGAFDSPALFPNGHIIAALLTGNSVVFKPSEKTPMVGQLLAEAVHEAGIPSGVFNMIQGERETGRRLCVHEGVDGVLFSGSYEVGTRIKQDTLLQNWKLLVLEMGGKNPSIIWEDADVDRALLETLVASFSSAGQRCTATSRVIIHRKLLDGFLDTLHQRAKSFRIGHPLDNPFMGPLIDESSVDRYMKFQGIAAREGCEIVMRGKSLDMKHAGNYVAPSICWVQKSSLEATKKSVYQQTELFGPNLAVLAVDDLDEAIAQANATQYGLIASVYSRDRAVFEKCREDLQMGCVNWNCPTTELSPSLPFGGIKKSGNHFPAGISSSSYCMYPVSTLELPEPRGNVDSFPGLNWAK